MNFLRVGSLLLILSTTISIQAKVATADTDIVDIAISSINEQEPSSKSTTVEVAVKELKKRYADLSDKINDYVDQFSQQEDFDMSNRMHRMILFADVSMRVDEYRDIYMQKHFNVLPVFVLNLLNEKINAHIVQYLKMLYRGTAKTALQVAQEYTKTLCEIAHECLNTAIDPVDKVVIIRIDVV